MPAQQGQVNPLEAPMRVARMGDRGTSEVSEAGRKKDGHAAGMQSAQAGKMHILVGQPRAAARRQARWQHRCIMHVQFLQADHLRLLTDTHHKPQHGCSPCRATQAVDIEGQKPDGPAGGAHGGAAPSRAPSRSGLEPAAPGAQVEMPLM